MALGVCGYCDRAWIGDDADQAAPVCPPCAELLESIYRAAWNHLRDAAVEPGGGRKLTAGQLADEMGVDVKAVEILIKTGRIEATLSNAQIVAADEKERSSRRAGGNSVAGQIGRLAQ